MFDNTGADLVWDHTVICVMYDSSSTRGQVSWASASGRLSRCCSHVGLFHSALVGKLRWIYTTLSLFFQLLLLF